MVASLVLGSGLLSESVDCSFSRRVCEDEERGGSMISVIRALESSGKERLVWLEREGEERESLKACVRIF